MAERETPDGALKAEMAAVIIYLSLGAAHVATKDKSTIELSRKGSAALQVSIKTLVALARKNWVKRDGQTLQITGNAPSRPIEKAVPAGRETEPFELIENGETRTVSRVTAESPIDYLACRKDKSGAPLLGKAEWNAGDRLRTDFTRANMLPGITMRWGEPVRTSGGAGGANQTDAAMAARERVNKALTAVGPEFSGLLIDVCCFLKGLTEVELERGWPPRSAKVMLRAALSILARHYAPPSNAAVKGRAWGAEGYRPTL